VHGQMAAATYAYGPPDCRADHSVIKPMRVLVTIVSCIDL